MGRAKTYMNMYLATTLRRARARAPATHACALRTCVHRGGRRALRVFMYCVPACVTVSGSGSFHRSWFLKLNMRLVVLGGLAIATPLVHAHGFVRYPPTIHDRDGTGVPEPNASLSRVAVPGCTGRHAPGEIETNQGCAEQWYENNTFIPGEPTICPTGHETNCAFKTMLNCPRNGTAYDHANGGPPGTGGAGPRLDSRGYWLNADGTNIGCNGSPGLPPTEGVDTTRTHPWRAPGTAPITSPWCARVVCISSPCCMYGFLTLVWATTLHSGIDGGNPRGCSPDTGVSGCMPGGYGHGPDGRSLMLRRGGQVTTWRRGSIVEVKWTIGANHNVRFQCPDYGVAQAVIRMSQIDTVLASDTFAGRLLVPTCQEARRSDDSY